MASSGSQDEAADKAEEEEPGKDTEESKPASPGTAPGTLMKRPASAQAASLKKNKTAKSPGKSKLSPAKAKGKPGKSKSPKPKKVMKTVAKPKASPGKKGGSPAKKSPVKRKPSTSSGQQPMKKPASKSHLRQVTQQLQEGAKGEQEDELAQVGEVEEEQSEAGSADEAETRNFAKARKFNKLQKSGALPQMVVQLLSKVEKEDGSRQKVTQLINSLIQKDKKTGHLSLNTDSSEFVSLKSKWKLVEDRDEVEGEPRNVFLHRVFGGNETALQAAIEAGDVRETIRGGTTFCCYPRFNWSTTNAVEDKGTISGKTDLDAGNYFQLASAFAEIAKGAKSQAPDSASATAAPAPAPRKALPEPVDFEKLKPLLTAAKDAISFLEKDMLRVKPRVVEAKDTDLTKSLRQVFESLAKQRNDVDGVLHFQEFPADFEGSMTRENVNKWLADLGKRTEGSEEGLASVKAVLGKRNL